MNGIDIKDTSHEFSPELQRPVVELLGWPWYMEAGSPGGDYVTWLDNADGSRIGVSPHPDAEGTMRWVIGFYDAAGQPTLDRHDNDLLITAAPEVVAAHVRRVIAQHDTAAATPPPPSVNEVAHLLADMEKGHAAARRFAELFPGGRTPAPTSMGVVEGFDYDRFRFGDGLDYGNGAGGFPIPNSYVVAYGMAHFRGPDGHLWFCPDNGTPGVIDWACPQNVREFDLREHGEDTTCIGPNYQAVMQEICRLVDQAANATARYGQPITTAEESTMTTTDTSFTAQISRVREAAARAKSGTLSPDETTAALAEAGDLIAALKLRAYPMGDDVDETKEQVVITVHGVDLSVRGRERDLFIHLDSTERDEDAAARFPLVVEVNDGGEQYHGSRS